MCLVVPSPSTEGACLVARELGVRLGSEAVGPGGNRRLVSSAALAEATHGSDDLLELQACLFHGLPSSGSSAAARWCVGRVRSLVRTSSMPRSWRARSSGERAPAARPRATSASSMGTLRW
jgi:hypothetical protein